VLSDTLDNRGLILLTRAGLRGKPVVSLVCVLCNLAHVNAWHAACARSKFSLCSEWDAAGHGTRGHEKSNDDRRTL
jgi:hypothetical protein